MAKTPEYTKGQNTEPGQGDQLPQGEASQLNQGAQQARENQAQQDQQQGQATEQYQPAPVETAPPPPAEPAMPQNEHEQLLFGPTDRPAEPVTAGTAPVGKQQFPKGGPAWLSTLQDAASDPDAPESVKNLFKLVVYHMNAGDQGA